MSVTINGSGAITFNDGSVQNTASLPGMRNRIINGDMRIDQRRAGNIVTLTNNAVVFTTDKWAFFEDVDGTATAQQVTDAPAGFINSLKVTVTSADTSLTSTQRFILQHRIEGYNAVDFAFGTANASPITLSFWVKSSLTGTFGGGLTNVSDNRGYAFTYTISSANTWEYKTVTIAGDTTGTWGTTNNTGLTISFGLGVGSSFSATAGSWVTQDVNSATGAVSVIGTNAATWQITGVQLEKGSTATPFDNRPYSTELTLCYRYYWKLTAGAANVPFGSGYNASTTRNYGQIFFPAQMRVAPTALEQSGTATDYKIIHLLTATTCSAVPAFDSASVLTANVTYTVASGLTAGHGAFPASASSTAYLAWSADL